jgi:hypothetical protein
MRERTQAGSGVRWAIKNARTNPSRVRCEVGDQKCANEPIYERADVKRGGADFVSRASRTSPSPSASVDLAHLRPVRRRVSYATRNTSSEPEAEGGLPPSLPAVYEALAERDVIRSTIYSGSTVCAVVAIKPVSKERHHSSARSQRWGRCQGSLRGRSPVRHVHRPSLDRWLALTEAGFSSLLVHHPSPGSEADPQWWLWSVTRSTFSPTSRVLS